MTDFLTNHLCNNQKEYIFDQLRVDFDWNKEYTVLPLRRKYI